MILLPYWRNLPVIKHPIGRVRPIYDVHTRPLMFETAEASRVCSRAHNTLKPGALKFMPSDSIISGSSAGKQAESESAVQRRDHRRAQLSHWAAAAVVAKYIILRAVATPAALTRRRPHRTRECRTAECEDCRLVPHALIGSSSTAAIILTTTTAAAV